MTTTSQKTEVADPESGLISEQNKERLNAKLEKRQGTVNRTKDNKKRKTASMGGVQRSMTLQTTYAQNLYAKSFNRTCQALYFLSLVLYEHMDDEDQVESVATLNDLIKTWLKEAIEDVEGRIETLDATILARPDLQGVTIRFTNPRNLVVEVTTPRIMLLQELTERVDEWHQKANLLWNLDAMSDKDRISETKKVNGNYRGVCNRIIKTHNQINGELKKLSSGGKLDLEGL